MSARWSQGATRNLARALAEGRRRRHDLIEPEHLLWSDLQDENGTIRKAATAAGVPLDDVQALVSSCMDRHPPVGNGRRISRP